MNTLSASLKLRPTRIGFLVDPEDAATLRKIFQTCTCLWGGVFNPLIPVCKALPDAWRDRHSVLNTSPEDLAKGYIRFFEPDVFVEGGHGLAAAISISSEDRDFSHPRVLPLDAFSRQGDPYQKDVPFGTDIFHVYEELYEREFKFVSRHERRVAIFESAASGDAFAAANFGEFPTEAPLSGRKTAYLDAFDAVKLEPTAENWVKAIRERYELPLHFTRECLKREPDGWSDPTLFVVDPSSPLDLIDLWNLRQFHPQVLGVSIAWMKDAKDFLVEFVKVNHRALPGNPNGVMIHTTVQFGRSISEDRAKIAVEEGGLTSINGNAWSFKLWYDDIWRSHREDRIVRPQRARISVASTDLELPISEEQGRSSCRFRSLSPDFAPTHGDGSARWVNVLELNKYGTNDTIAVTLPLTYHGKGRRGMRIGETTIVSREGFVLPQTYKEHGEYFRLLTGQQAVVEWLKSESVVAEPSDPGRIADQMLVSLGGFWGTGLVADVGTIKLLDEMSKSVRRYVDGTLEEFPDRSIEVNRWKEVIGRRSKARKFGYVPDMDTFVKAKVLRLGLVLECPNCRKKNWFGVEGLREQLTCERCLKDYAFPQGSLPFDRTPWHYRVLGPYSVPNYAEGAYATVLTLNAFARGLGHDRANITYATGLHFRIGNENPFEVDFTFWYRRKRMFDLQEEPVLVFGEGKSFATESFKPEDVARMRKLAEKFPGAFHVFAALKADLTDVEKRVIGEFATWGRERLADGRPRAPVIALTGTELFAGWEIEHAWKDMGDPHAKFVRHPGVRIDNLWTLADITQQLYLGLPDPYARLVQPTVKPEAAAPSAKTDNVEIRSS
jgi:hypothetical protein